MNLSTAEFISSTLEWVEYGKRVGKVDGVDYDIEESQDPCASQ